VKRSVETDGGSKPEEGQVANWEDGNCSNINEFSRDEYNNSCEVVKEECGDSYELFNYLQFVTCDLNRVSVGCQKYQSVVSVCLSSSR